MSRQRDDIILKRAMAVREIEEQEAFFARELAFYPSSMCQIALPASACPGSEYHRDNGDFHLSILTPETLGIPYGLYPRAILTYITSSIVKRKNSGEDTRIVPLGANLSEFIHRVSGTTSFSGGKTGNIRPFKRQLASLLGSTIHSWYDGPVRSPMTRKRLEDLAGRKGSALPESQFQGQGMLIASDFNLFWNALDSTGLLQSWLRVGERFHDDCLHHGVLVDMRVIRALWPSILAFDIYVWLCHRAASLLKTHRHTIDIPWSLLKLQFGQQYKEMKVFRFKFLNATHLVRRFYSDFEFREEPGTGLKIRFRNPSVKTFMALRQVPGILGLPPAAEPRPLESAPAQQNLDLNSDPGQDREENLPMQTVARLHFRRK